LATRTGGLIINDEVMVSFEVKLLNKGLADMTMRLELSGKNDKAGTNKDGKNTK
jgi:uncharacterized membrane protein